jgi:hypothetical protein
MRREALAFSDREEYGRPMTWLVTGGTDALEAQPETYALWRLTLREAHRVADAGLLGLCRSRIAEIYGREGAGAPLDVERRHGAEAFTDVERAALGYVEQLMIDQNGLMPEQKAELSSLLPSGTLHDFTFAAYTVDADLRARTLLRISTDAPPLDHEVPARGDESLFPFPGVDTGYSKALGRFGNDACSQSLVDDTTSEVCRLRNADHQQCHY